MQELNCRSDLDAIIFDLDGTLWDTCGTCAIAWNNVIHRNGIKFREIVPDDVKKVTGLPHEQCIRNVFQGLLEAEIQVLISGTETEDNVMVEKLGGDLYPFVSEGLQQLAVNLPLFIVSNCQKGYIETFLAKTEFSNYFVDFECWGNTGKTKGENLHSIIERNNLKNPVYVGDTVGDQQATMTCSVPYWFVSYGFGKCLGANHDFENFEQLVRFALHLKSSSNFSEATITF